MRLGRPITSRRTEQRELGFTYIGLLLAVAVLGVGLLAASEVWVATANRQKATEARWIGRQFVKAIGSYYHASPSAKAFPPSLNDLVLDKRHLTLRRHLREVYRNPFTGQVDWELIADPRGGIRGVRVRLRAGDGTPLVEDFAVQQDATSDRHPTRPGPAG